MFSEELIKRISTKADFIGISPALAMSLVGTMAKFRLGLIKVDQLGGKAIEDYASILAEMGKSDTSVMSREISDHAYRNVAGNPNVGSILANTSGTEPITNKDATALRIALQDFDSFHEKLQPDAFKTFHETFLNEILSVSKAVQNTF